jgi:tRNA-uridine 2-sulfurtransferase
VQGHDHAWLQSLTVQSAEAHWIGGAAPFEGTPLAAKTRYRQLDAACRFSAAAGDAFALAFDSPQWAVTPGQSAVVYQGDVCLGGGVIA